MLDGDGVDRAGFERDDGGGIAAVVADVVPVTAVCFSKRSMCDFGTLAVEFVVEAKTERMLLLGGQVIFNAIENFVFESVAFGT